jgi:hypothetical protein
MCPNVSMDAALELGLEVKKKPVAGARDAEMRFQEPLLTLTG